MSSMNHLYSNFKLSVSQTSLTPSSTSASSSSSTPCQSRHCIVCAAAGHPTKTKNTMDHRNLKIIIPKTTESSRPSSRSSHLQGTHASPRDSQVTLVESYEPRSFFHPDTPELEKNFPENPKCQLSVLVIESMILAVAATTLGLASAYGVQLVKAPRISDILPNHYVTPSQDPTDHTSLHRRLNFYNNNSRSDGNTWAIFYNGTMPLLSIIFAILGTILALGRRLTPVYSIIISAAFLAGWCVNLGWWITCDWSVTAHGYGTPRGKF
jgi:hypothetical protein